MKKLLFILFVLCTIKNGVANPLNDSIYNYLERNLRYPTIYQENEITANIIVGIKRTDSSALWHTIYKDTKMSAFKEELFRILKKKDFKNLLQIGDAVILNINFNLLNVDLSSLISDDTLLVSTQEIDMILKSPNVIYYSFNAGENRLRERDSLINMYSINPEQIWLINSDTLSTDIRKKISKKELKSSKIIVRYKVINSFFSIKYVNRFGREKKTFSTQEISINKNNTAKTTIYFIVGRKTKRKENEISTDKFDSLVTILNNIRSLPNQLPNKRHMSDGTGYTFEIFYNNRYRKIYYYAPYASSSFYYFDTEFLKLMSVFLEYFK